MGLQLSIIIPTYNEAKNVGQLINYLIKHSNEKLVEIIVVDANSNDNTKQIAKNAGAKVIESKKTNRAIQMNLGAKRAIGNLLYFIHADSLPPESYIEDITSAISENYKLGCYRFRFDSSNLLLRLNSFFTRFDYDFCRGGDQSLFILKRLFSQFGGYDERYCIMEEYELLSRIRKENEFKIIPKDILVSARKYENNSYLSVQFANLSIFRMYRQGASPKAMLQAYKKLIDHRSL